MDEATRARADLIPYSKEYSGIVRSWIDTPETYDLVCRGINFPPPEDIVESWQRKGVSSFLLFADRKPVAYGELWERKAEQAVEITHLIVETYMRSKGYGTKMLQLLYDLGATRPGIAKVLINLYHDSQEALGCCVKAGFEITGTAAHIEGLKMMRLVKKDR